MTEAAQHRSRVMRAVKSKDTEPEMAVRRLVYRMGYRYRLHRKDLPGNPDLVFGSRKKVIFVHGCFWHGHDCKRGSRMPKSNRNYWEQKISRNQERDREHLKALKAGGWRALVLWECELKENGEIERRLSEFLEH
ncbi:very short patch repair endonuclease [Wenzhouxiangella sp. EGI_FJ10305]|uniref:very short patch repair endonuclease n=1 Tax=Wenzhouxiangella sp. EGI_FJ10305 TaxID=3243768 RepID=UPI0035D56764